MLVFNFLLLFTSTVAVHRPIPNYDPDDKFWFSPPSADAGKLTKMYDLHGGFKWCHGSVLRYGFWEGLNAFTIYMYLEKDLYRLRNKVTIHTGQYVYSLVGAHLLTNDREFENFNSKHSLACFPDTGLPKCTLREICKARTGKKPFPLVGTCENKDFRIVERGADFDPQCVCYGDCDHDCEHSTLHNYKGIEFSLGYRFNSKPPLKVSVDRYGVGCIDGLTSLAHTYWQTANYHPAYLANSGVLQTFRLRKEFEDLRPTVLNVTISNRYVCDDAMSRRYHALDGVVIYPTAIDCTEFVPFDFHTLICKDALFVPMCPTEVFKPMVARYRYYDITNHRRVVGALDLVGAIQNQTGDTMVDHFFDHFAGNATRHHVVRRSISDWISGVVEKLFEPIKYLVQEILDLIRPILVEIAGEIFKLILDILFDLVGILDSLLKKLEDQIHNLVDLIRVLLHHLFSIVTRLLLSLECSYHLFEALFLVAFFRYIFHSIYIASLLTFFIFLIIGFERIYPSPVYYYLSEKFRLSVCSVPVRYLMNLQGAYAVLKDLFEYLSGFMPNFLYQGSYDLFIIASLMVSAFIISFFFSDV
ncbi:hypothetical protein [Hubei virga-like virus 15]|uniref:hypothetical protein n=1 Tax=Hubei virga-like virus 15 TaxID=1923330 RepID=UPI00090B46F8|nr:hypothetical protein [Hubei virga-like virus 15]APG77658.1 hypothetical protein [Hubei virga-like virus 15]